MIEIDLWIYLTLWAEPVTFRLGRQFEALGMIDSRAELAAQDLALPVTHPAIEVVPAVLRYNINRVICGECGLLHIVKWTMSEFGLKCRQKTQSRKFKIQTTATVTSQHTILHHITFSNKVH